MYLSEGQDPSESSIAFVEIELGPEGLHDNHFQSIQFRDDR